MEKGRESRTEVAVNARMRTFFSLGTPRRTGRSEKGEIERFVRASVIDGQKGINNKKISINHVHWYGVISTVDVVPVPW